MNLVTCFAVLLLQAQSTALAKPITLEETCIGTKQLMQKLSDQSGVKLSAIDDILNDNLAILVKAVPLGDLMKHLAEAESGEWQQIANGFRFARSEAKLQAERSAKQQNRIEQFKESQAVYRSKPALQDPRTHALQKILLKFPLKPLSEIEPKQELLYSSSPTQVESPIPIDLGPILGDLASDEAANPKPDSTGKHISRLVIAFLRNSEASGLRVRMFLLDGDGGLIDQEAVNFGKVSATEFSNGNALQKRVEPLPSEQEAITLFARGFTNKPVDRSSLSSTLVGSLLHPDKAPVASLFAGPILARLSALENKNMVAVLTEDLVQNIADLASKRPSGYSINDMGLSASPTEVAQADGWETVRPKYFDDYIQGRINVSALVALLKTVTDEAQISIDAISKFALASKEESVTRTSIVAEYLDAADDYGQKSLWSNNFKLLQLYATLTAQQRIDLENSVPLGRLSNDQQSIVQVLVFSPETRLDVHPAGPLQTVVQSANPLNGFASEVLPQGLSGNGTVQLSGYSFPELLVREAYNGFDQGLQAIDMTHVAWMTFTSSQNKDQVYTFQSFQPAKHTQLEFQFVFSPTVGFKGSLTQDSANGNRVSDVGQLPADMKKEYDRMLTSFQNAGYVLPTSGSSVAPPPL